MSASQITNNKDKISQYSNCCVAFGSNILSKLGSPLEIVHQAMKEIQTSKFELVLTSNLYETVAYPKGSGPNFINCCAVYKTKLNASETLLHLHSIEKCLGRIRNKRWAPRVIDLDLIYFDEFIYPNQEVVQEWIGLSKDEQIELWPTEMILPHPRLQDRAFVLIPMCDIDPKWKHPILKNTVSEMLNDIDSKLLAEIKKI